MGLAQFFKSVANSRPVRGVGNALAHGFYGPGEVSDQMRGAAIRDALWGIGSTLASGGDLAQGFTAAAQTADDRMARMTRLRNLGLETGGFFGAPVPMSHGVARDKAQERKATAGAPAAYPLAPTKLPAIY